MDRVAIERSITRLCHEILEQHHRVQDAVLVGIHNRGVPLAGRIRNKISDFTGCKLDYGSLDITFPP